MGYNWLQLFDLILNQILLTRQPTAKSTSGHHTRQPYSLQLTTCITALHPCASEPAVIQCDVAYMAVYNAAE